MSRSRGSRIWMDSVKCPRLGLLYSCGFVEVRGSIDVILSRAMKLRAYKSLEFLRRGFAFEGLRAARLEAQGVI